LSSSEAAEQVSFLILAVANLTHVTGPPAREALHSLNLSSETAVSSICNGSAFLVVVVVVVVVVFVVDQQSVRNFCRVRVVGVIFGIHD
jgi:preprotein translocase subunit SecF